MKLRDCKESYDYYSGKASDIIRNLGFFGLALIWAFRICREDKVEIPVLLRVAGLLLLLGLALDFFHYLVAAVMWGGYHRWKEQKVSSDKEFKAPKWINYPGNAFFAMKMLAIVGAYVLLFISMMKSFWC